LRKAPASHGVRGLATAIVVAACLLGSACGSSSPGAASGPIFHLVYGGSLGANDPTTLAQYTFKKLVEQRSNGRITVTVAINSTLGAPAQLLTQTRANTIQITPLSQQYVAGLAPRFAVLSLPFIFPSTDKATQVLAGPAGQALDKDLEQKAGLKILAWDTLGFDQLQNKVRPVNSLADIKGLKLRIAPDDISSKTLQAVGAIPVGMAYTEIYTSLQQGVIDGENLPITVFAGNNHVQIAKYVTIDNLWYNPNIVFMNLDAFNSLPKDLQAVVLGAAKDTQKEELANVANGEAKAYATVKTNGGQVNTLSADALTQWRAATQPLYDSLASTDGADFIKLFTQ
jgi:tripartite ATP-independent transporter DctP family solute receptor